MAKFTKLNIGDAVASGGGRVFKKLSTMTIPTEQLPSPYGVTIDGDTLTWGDYSALATNFDILVDGVVSANTTEQSFPLSYFGFSDGTYSISVVSKADGYLDSEPSEAVTYTVSESIVGTWVWNNSLTNFPDTTFTFGRSSGSVAIATSKYYNASRSVRGIGVGNIAYLAYYNTDNSTNYCYDGGWDDTSAKTITFNSNAENAQNYEAFFAFLKANATKQ